MCLVIVRVCVGMYVRRIVKVMGMIYMCVRVCVRVCMYVYGMVRVVCMVHTCVYACVCTYEGMYACSPYVYC